MHNSQIKLGQMKRLQDDLDEASQMQTTIDRLEKELARYENTSQLQKKVKNIMPL